MPIDLLYLLFVDTLFCQSELAPHIMHMDLDILSLNRNDIIK